MPSAARPAVRANSPRLLVPSPNRTRIVSLAFSPNGRRLEAVSDHGAVYVWDPIERMAIPEATAQLSHPASFFILTGENAGTRIERGPWRLDKSRGSLPPLPSGSGEPSLFAWAPDRSRFAAVFLDEIRMHDASGRETWRIKPGSRSIDFLEFSPTGRSLATGCRTGRYIRLFNAETGRPNGKYIVEPPDACWDPLGAIAFSPNEYTLAAGLVGDVVALYRIDAPCPELSPPSTRLGASVGPNEKSAIAALNTFVTAEEQFKCGGGIYASLPALSDSTPPYLSDELGSGTKDGYAFAHVVGTPADSNWYAQGNPILPGKTGRRYFFVDSSGVVRFHPSRPATSADSPIP